MNDAYKEERDYEEWRERREKWYEKHGDKDSYKNYHANAEYETINCATGEITINPDKER